MLVIRGRERVRLQPTVSNPRRMLSVAKDARISPVPLGKATFLDSPRCDDLDALDADIAVLGVPFGYPYDLAGLTSPSSSALVTGSIQPWPRLSTISSFSPGATSRR